VANSSEILYFDRPGPANTEALIDAVCRRAQALGIDRVVVASNSGATALAFQKALQEVGASVVCVTEHAGWDGGDSVAISEATRADLEAAGAVVLTCSHALSGVARSIGKKFGGVSQVEMMAHTLRLMGEGIKVVVEVAIMAADAGLVPTDCEIITVGGTGRGADAAAVLRAAHMNNVFDLEIREIIAKPRQRKPD
jgi:hypothetical protein